MKPLRRRAHDTLMNGPANRDELAVDHAVAPFDRTVREMNATWGLDRLAELVSPDTAAKYGRTLASLNAAIAANDADRAADRAAACIRGMMAMDAEARANGHTTPKSGTLVIEVDGRKFGFLPDPALYRQAMAEHPNTTIRTLRELVVLIKAAEIAHPGLADVLDAFPGAEITAVRKRTKLDDPIPF